MIAKKDISEISSKGRKGYSMWGEAPINRVNIHDEFKYDPSHNVNKIGNVNKSEHPLEFDDTDLKYIDHEGFFDLSPEARYIRKKLDVSKYDVPKLEPIRFAVNKGLASVSRNKFAYKSKAIRIAYEKYKSENPLLFPENFKVAKVVEKKKNYKDYRNELRSMHNSFQLTPLVNELSCSVYDNKNIWFMKRNFIINRYNNITTLISKFNNLAHIKVKKDFKRIVLTKKYRRTKIFSTNYYKRLMKTEQLNKIRAKLVYNQLNYKKDKRMLFNDCKRCLQHIVILRKLKHVVLKDEGSVTDDFFIKHSHIYIELHKSNMKKFYNNSAVIFLLKNQIYHYIRFMKYNLYKFIKTCKYNTLYSKKLRWITLSYFRYTDYISDEDIFPDGRDILVVDGCYEDMLSEICDINLIDDNVEILKALYDVYYLGDEDYRLPPEPFMDKEELFDDCDSYIELYKEYRISYYLLLFDIAEMSIELLYDSDSDSYDDLYYMCNNIIYDYTDISYVNLVMYNSNYYIDEYDVISKNSLDTIVLMDGLSRINDLSRCYNKDSRDNYRLKRGRLLFYRTKFAHNRCVSINKKRRFKNLNGKGLVEPCYYNKSSQVVILEAPAFLYGWNQARMMYYNVRAWYY